jgi:hypothetical protein
VPFLVAVLAFALTLQAQSTVLAPTGTLRATFIVTNPVQGRVDARTGATTGPAPDLVRELARRLGVSPVVTPARAWRSSRARSLACGSLPTITW